MLALVVFAGMRVFCIPNVFLFHGDVAMMCACACVWCEGVPLIWRGKYSNASAQGTKTLPTKCHFLIVCCVIFLHSTHIITVLVKLYHDLEFSVYTHHPCMLLVHQTQSLLLTRTQVVARVRVSSAMPFHVHAQTTHCHEFTCTHCNAHTDTDTYIQTHT